MSGIPTDFTRDTLGLMGKQVRFFDSVVEVSRRNGVGLQITSPGSHSVLERTPQGDWSLQMHYILDDNYQRADGYLLLKDTFIFSQGSLSLIDFKRQWEQGGISTFSPLWSQRKLEFEKASLPDRDQRRDFLSKVGLSLVRPVYSNESLWRAIAGDAKLRNYFTRLGEEIRKRNPDLRLRILDPQSHYQMLQEGGNTTWVFRWVLDGDNDENNGRYFLEERLVPSAKVPGELEIKRRILAPDRLWAAGDEASARAAFFSPEGLSDSKPDPGVESYRSLMAHLTLEKHDWENRQIEKKLQQVTDLGEAFDRMGEQGRSYWLDFVAQAQRIHPRLSLHTKDPDSWVRVRPLGPYWEVLLQTVLADFQNPQKNRVLVRDRFTVNGNARKLLSWSRELHGDGTIPGMDDLKSLPVPDLDQRERFIAALAPAILPLSTDQWESFLAPEVDGEEIIMEPGTDSPTEVLNRPLLDLFRWVLLDWVAKKNSEGKAWLGNRSSLSSAQVESLMGQIGAFEESEIFPGLKYLSLSEDVKPLVREIYSDPLLCELLDIFSESDEVLRNHDLLSFARNRLFRKNAMSASALAFAQSLVEDREIGKDAVQLAEFLNGRGSLGTKFDLLGANFVDHLLDRNTLVAMMAAGMGGAWVETRLSNVLRFAGKMGSGFAKVGGTFSEAATFTLTQQLGQSFDQDPARVWAHTGSHLASAALLFGFLRGGHWASENISRYFSLNMGTGWRGGFWGNSLKNSLQLFSGVEGMYLGGLVSRRLGLEETSGQSTGHYQFDALVSYLQAHAGFSLAHALSPHGIQNTFRKLQFEKQYSHVSSETIPPKNAEPESNSVETDPSSDPTPIPPPIPFDASPGLPSRILKLPLPPPPVSEARNSNIPPPLPPPPPPPRRASTEGKGVPEGEVILLDQPKPRKTPPLPPPPPPAKVSSQREAPQGRRSRRKSDWWDEPTEPHGKIQVSETILQETLPGLMREVISRWAVKRLIGLPEASGPQIQNLSFNLGALLERSRVFPQNTAKNIYGRYRFRIPVRMDPLHRQLTLPPEPKRALQLKAVEQQDPVLKVVYDILVGLDGLQLGPAGKSAGKAGRDRFPTAQPLEPNYPADSRVLEENQERLKTRYHETAPRQLDLAKETVVPRSRYLAGPMWIDGEGRIDVRGLIRPNFDSPQLIQSLSLPNSEAVGISVIVAKDQVVWHGPLPDKMTEIQKATLNALTERAPQWYEVDPYGVDALLGKDMGPLALDLGDLLVRQSRKVGEAQSHQDIMIFLREGVLRAKEEKSSEDPQSEKVMAHLRGLWSVDSEGRVSLKNFQFLRREKNIPMEELNQLLEFIQNRFSEMAFGNGRLVPTKTPTEIQKPDSDLKILMGERQNSVPMELLEKMEPDGEFYGVTEEGIGYKSFNEDGLAVLKGPKGDNILLLMDGAGGHAPAKDAVELSLKKISELVLLGEPLSEAIFSAHESFLSSFSECRSTFLAVRLLENKAQFFWVGDSKAFVIRKDAQGKWQWVYQTKEDSQARRLVDTDIENAADEKTKRERWSRRTREIVLHPFSHYLSNAFGETTMKLHETQDGIFRNSENSGQGVFVLQPGDVVLVASDGFLDNQIESRRYLDLIEGVNDPELIGSLLYRDTRYAMQVLAQAKHSLKSGTLKPGERFAFRYEGEVADWRGKTLFLELQAKGNGLLFAGPEGGEPLAHFKADNLSIGVYGYRPPDPDSI